MEKKMKSGKKHVRYRQMCYHLRFVPAIPFRHTPACLLEMDVVLVEVSLTTSYKRICTTFFSVILLLNCRPTVGGMSVECR